MSEFKVGDYVRVTKCDVAKWNNTIGRIELLQENVIGEVVRISVEGDTHTRWLYFREIELAGPYAKYHVMAREVCGSEYFDDAEA